MSNCPKCNNSEAIVKDSRHIAYRNTTVVRRRRSCLKCNHKFNTYELPETLILMAEAKNFTKELGKVKLLAMEMADILAKEGINYV